MRSEITAINVFVKREEGRKAENKSYVMRKRAEIKSISTRLRE